MVSIKPIYEVSINVPKTNNRIIHVIDKGREELHKMMLNDSNYYIKVVSGDLRDSGYYDENGIYWDIIYANVQYNNDRVSENNINPRATGHWFEAAKKAYFNKWLDKLQEVMYR